MRYRRNKSRIRVTKQKTQDFQRASRCEASRVTLQGKEPAVVEGYAACWKGLKGGYSEKERQRERRERGGKLCELLSRHPAGGDCRLPLFFFFFVECTLAHIFTFSTLLRVTCVPPSALPRRSVLCLRSVMSVTLFALSTLLSVDSELREWAPRPSFATRDRGCAIATAVGKPGEPDQLQYRDTQTYWRNSRNLREAFGIPRWRVYPHSGLTWEYLW